MRWFGVTSLAGHVRNFVASAIAAESVDARDWMQPASAGELLAQVVRGLGGDRSKATLVEAIGREVWIDFVADTGDDHDVSQAVARMLFAEYAIEESGRRRILPRGDILLFGGDTAYPVATGEEIARRVIAPWNEVLRERDGAGEGTGPAREAHVPVRRVLLGIPGNHDWYDGLDGFGRLFRRRPHGIPPEEEAPRSSGPRSQPRPRAEEARQAGSRDRGAAASPRRGERRRDDPRGGVAQR